MDRLLAIFFSLLFTCGTLFSSVSVQVIRGADCQSQMSMLCTLRLNTFIEFPYLYVGNEYYEEMYVSCYPKNPDSLIFLFYFKADRDAESQLAGILTGTPLTNLSEDDPEIFGAFNDAGLEISQHYYVGEAIILKPFQNKKILQNLATQFEAEIKHLGYKYATFITVEREQDHPLRPIDYVDTAFLWHKLGFTKTMMRSIYNWPTLQPDGSVNCVDNSVAWWIKEL